ncbi:hypothetical protein CIK05_08540 [Bdellovibrio sp. qaytius]|nr:hypothetical protein CIK05_08540 [Bdellovibrio sp. qaytius]
MNAGFMKNVIRFAAATGSVLTMIFSPVALGVQSEDTLQKQIEAFMSETQLNKRITYQEFWNKTKHLYSGQVYKDVERYLTSSPNELMPEFSLKESLSSTGDKIPTLTISENGKSHTMQIFGEKAKFAKFNNVILTENDMMLITPAMKRLMASDIKIKKEHDRKLTKANTNKFASTPKITREMWKKMTPMEHAQFMMNMRLLYSGAQDVIDAKSAIDAKKPAAPSKGKKTSSLEKWNMFFAMLNDEAEADAAAGTKCVVAGYIGTYGSDKKCKYPFNVKAGGCNFPCNPTIYGFDNGGKQFCLGNESELQTATHYNKGCDAKMPLTSVELPLPAKNAKKDASRYDNVLEENKRRALRDEAAMTNTKKYLDSMLIGTPDLKEAFEKGNITDDLLKKLQEIQSQFDSTISAARQDCAAAAVEKDQYDKNFWGACDQLHKRFLFVAEFLTKKPGCPDNKSVNAETLKCPCDGGGEANPGAQCVAVLPPAVSTPAVSEPVGSSSSLQCTNGTVEKEGSCVCEDGKEPSGKDDDKKCGSGFNWKPWLIGAGVIGGAALLYFLFKKKKKDKPDKPVPPPPVVTPPTGCQNVCAANTTQNPTTCSCDPIVQQPTCTAPQMLNGGVCGCPTTNACTPGQQVYNLSTCQCDTVVQASVCADGVSPYYTPPGPSSCPAPTVCQNGSQVYPPATCPPVTEGGSGNNCPSGDCSGGVPSAN